MNADGNWARPVLRVVALSVLAACDGGAVPAAPPSEPVAEAGAIDGAVADGAGTCLSGTPSDVDDGNPCTLDACDPVVGTAHVPAAEGAPCDDGDPCNGAETCDGAGVCRPGMPPDLDDGDPCTLDTCDAAAGVAHAPAPVDDGDPCTLDACDAVLGVTHAACSPLDLTTSSAVGAAAAFLFGGPAPAQVGVAPGAIEMRRAAVVRGHVRRKDGAPLSGVTIEALGHPEYGSTTTFADGMFSMVVNGGGALVITYGAEGYLQVARRVDVPWQAYARAPDVVMIPLDDAVTTVDLAAITTVEVARGSLVADADGVRQATVLFPAGTTADMILPGGATVPLTTLNVRATEYTVGDAGEDAMPATLPPASAYTYALELSVDEALAAGASSVEFNQPLPFYVENFLGFPVGMDVPVAYYDRSRGVWVPSQDGRPSLHAEPRHPRHLVPRHLVVPGLASPSAAPRQNAAPRSRR